MSKDFFIADTHFGDEGIIKFGYRPFSNSTEMDDRLIKNWNEVVTDEDTVWVIGDFCLSNDKKVISDILSKLNGKKILVKGNHDEESDEVYRECGFSSVYSYPVIIKEFYILSHHPLHLNDGMPYFLIYGHIHGNPIYKTRCSHGMCVSVERIDYRPISFEEIKNYSVEK